MFELVVRLQWQLAEGCEEWHYVGRAEREIDEFGGRILNKKE